MPHVFEIEQVLKLLAAAKAEDESDWLMLLVTFVHGLRAHEVVGGTVSWKLKKTGEKRTGRYTGLKPSHIVGEKLVLKRLKNSNPVEDELLTHSNPLLNERPALFALCRKTPVNQRLFPICARTFQRRVHKYGELAGLPELYSHPHTLKHSILAHLRETMDLDELQDRSGHKSLDSLRVYLHPKKAVTDAKVNSALGSIGV